MNKIIKKVKESDYMKVKKIKIKDKKDEKEVDETLSSKVAFKTYSDNDKRI